MRKFFSLIAAVLFAGSMMAADVTISKSINDLFPDDVNGTQEATLYSDSYLTISVNADGNNGKVYGNGTEWRLYQTNSPVVTLTATNATIKTVAFNFTTKNTGILTYGGATVASDAVTTVNAASAQFVVSNSGTATNGQVIIKSFVVVYETSGEVTPVEQYYLVGSMNSWAIDAAYKLTPNNAAEGTEYKIDITLTEGNQEMKVKGVLEGRTEDAWYPDNAANFVINDAGDYTIYFRPDGQGDQAQGWYYGYIFAEYHEPYVKPEVFDVAQIIADATAGHIVTNDSIAVRGVITKIEAKGKNFAKYGSVNIYVADATGAEGSFEFYNCYSLAADTFRTTVPAYDATSTAWTEFTEVADANSYAIHVGDTVIAKGKYTYYAQASMHELQQGCYLVPGAEYPTAIENAAAEQKAVKVIRNGQLFIEKNGVLYNAQGTIVR